MFIVHRACPDFENTARRGELRVFRLKRKKRRIEDASWVPSRFKRRSVRKERFFGGFASRSRLCADLFLFQPFVRVFFRAPRLVRQGIDISVMEMLKASLWGDPFPPRVRHGDPAWKARETVLSGVI